MLHIIPPATTWPRSRHSGLHGQRPPRSREAPFGLSSLNSTEDKKVRDANSVLESLVWCVEQALRCPAKVVGLTIVFPEDLGGRQDVRPRYGCYVNFNSWRASVMPAVQLHTWCQITGADFKRPLGVFYHAHLSPRPVVTGLATVGETARETSCTKALFL